jgi:hypothetical protein
MIIRRSSACEESTSTARTILIPTSSHGRHCDASGPAATAVPLGLSKDGLPVGVQIVGPFLEDRTPLKLAELIEREFGGFTPPPLFDD